MPLSLDTSGDTDGAALLSAVVNPARLAAVTASGLLDSAPEGAFDDLAQLALAITGARMAFFTVADGHRSFWKSAVGVDPALGRQDRITDSPTHLLIVTRAPLIVEDARADPRIKDLPAVDALDIGAWAGFPVVSPGGHVLGGFCVVDSQQRAFTPAQVTALQTLARSVSSEIALRQALQEAQAAQAASARLARTSAVLARTLQDSLLPPHLPVVPGLDVAALYLPADATGAQVVGDFYDLFPTPDASWCAVMGDVSGKGVEAAKVTALARYTIRTEATQHPRPAVVLHRLHQAMVDQRITDRFLTIALAVLRRRADGVSGHLSSGGHLPALIRRTDGRVEELDAPGTLISPCCGPTRSTSPRPLSTWARATPCCCTPTGSPRPGAPVATRCSAMTPWPSPSPAPAI